MTSRGSRWQRRGRLGVGLVLAVALAGCAGTRPSGDPTVASTAESGATSAAEGERAPAVTASEVPGIVADYDVRNNAAIAAASASFDTAGWADADTGALLESDVFTTKLDQAQEDHGPTGGLVLTHGDPIGYLPAVESAAPWFLVRAMLEGKPRLIAFTHQGPSTAWKSEASVELTAEAGEPAAPGAPSTADPARAAAVRAAVAATITQIDDPGTPMTPMTGPLARHRQHLDLNASGLGADTYTSTTTPYAGDIAAQGEEGGSTRVVRTADGGQLVLASLRNRIVFTREGGKPLEHGPDFAAVTGQVGPQSSLTYDFLVGVALRLDAAGTATMIGSSLGNLPVT